MKKIFFLALLSIALTTNNVLADTDYFNNYNENIKFCEEKYKNNKIIFKIEEFKNATYYENDNNFIYTLKSWINKIPVKKAVYIYKENMNSIYKCAMIWVQRNSLNLILSLAKNSNSTDLTKWLEQKVKNMISRLEMTWKASKCELLEKDNIYSKNDILKQATYATCKYSFYMQYLKYYYDDINNTIKKDSSTEWKNYISKTDIDYSIWSIRKWIKQEYDNSLKVFPIAYNAYSEYENNYPIHFMLELIKEDFIVFRENLHAVLNPLNQVVYKISNAMKK